MILAKFSLFSVRNLKYKCGLSEVIVKNGGRTLKKGASDELRSPGELPEFRFPNVQYIHTKNFDYQSITFLTSSQI